MTIPSSACAHRHSEIPYPEKRPEIQTWTTHLAQRGIISAHHRMRTPLGRCGHQSHMHPSFSLSLDATLGSILAVGEIQVMLLPGGCMMQGFPWLLASRDGQAMRGS